MLMVSTPLVLLAHAAATLFMVGLIWFVQVVHYPLFAKVGPDAFVPYAVAHGTLTGLVVGPPMLLELLTAGWLVVRPPPGVNPLVPWVGLALVGLLWLSTGFVQVPLHETLRAGFQQEAWRRLVVTNLLRTALWTGRGGLALFMLWRAMTRAEC
ncbi:MAG TPA: hypothetical protein VF794_15620 [Archangium sp.]|jgi:hypothetical protein|uniref:hypothetical protein n=1 Tax=Archangium sp. TaxID=1872627 RepID=UPI002EDB3742